MQAAMVILNIIVLLFVASAGSYAGFKNRGRHGFSKEKSSQEKFE